MKKIALAGTTLALLMAAGSALADNSLNGGVMGFTVDTAPNNTLINGKYLITKNMAVLAGVGLTNTSGTGGGTNWGIMGGFRDYLKTEDFAPFVGGRFTYNSFAGGNSNWGLGVEGGAEYFLNKHFSLEGRVGVGYGSTTVTVPGPVIFGVQFPSTSTTVNTLGTTTAALAANFYF